MMMFRASSVQVFLLSVSNRKKSVPKNRHSSPRIQPYAMILKWRGVWWSAPSIFRGLVAKARPQARQSSFDGISAIFRCSIFHRKNGQNKARIGPFDPGRRGSIDLDARNRFHPTFPGQKCQKIWKLGKNCRKNWTIRKIFGPSQYTNIKNMDPFKGLLYFLPSSLGG